MGLVIQIVHFIIWALSILVVAEVILSYFMSPYHPVRAFIGRIIGPMLNPIRRVVPPIMNLDFSPLILLLLLQAAEWVIVSILNFIG
ncbi:YGGT family [Longilinea arvoryzae]|uniref:YGGT family n=1 Tax=Longilinea arvoryzae TaxID=360412 RepID=A0A0S7BJS9_9CHLR|nr:YggT family protein [Longilinea arvoryzae]GAP14742.1 YGGT family [Longilinea arvoryzae]